MPTALCRCRSRMRALSLPTESSLLLRPVRGSFSSDAGARLDTLLAGKDVVVLGPGISGHDQTARVARRLATQSPLPLVLDADGLNAFAGHSSELMPRGSAAPLRVLTPHPGE